MENFLKYLPEPGTIIQEQVPAGFLPEVNGHIHTPYSFSAFSDVAPIFDMAVGEEIKILGINDFYVTGGYAEFHKHAVEKKVFPLFNIEFIALDTDLQKKGTRVNDPNNPGRTYFSGKGLDFPESMDRDHSALVDQVTRESHKQVRSMIDKTNELLGRMNAGFQLDFEEIRKKYARELVRERHIAKSLRLEIFNRLASGEERKTFLTGLYGGKAQNADLSSHSAIENEIRNNLLKAGGQAFVEEDEKAFLSVDSVMAIIRNAGGIPCYPVLLDDSKGNITEFEADKEALLATFTRRNIFCIELIPGRNDATILADFVRFFSSKGFIILLGTEHNTPDMAPLTISCRNRQPLPEDLKKISFQGACLIAAHQYLRTNGLESPVSRWNILGQDERDYLLTLGKAVVYHFLTH